MGPFGAGRRTLKPGLAALLQFAVLACSLGPSSCCNSSHTPSGSARPCRFSDTPVSVWAQVYSCSRCSERAPAKSGPRFALAAIAEEFLGALLKTERYRDSRNQRTDSRGEERDSTHQEGGAHERSQDQRRGAQIAALKPVRLELAGGREGVTGFSSRVTAGVPNPHSRQERKKERKTSGAFGRRLQQEKLEQEEECDRGAGTGALPWPSMPLWSGQENTPPVGERCCSLCMS